jgi:hypothetical protein
LSRVELVLGFIPSGCHRFYMLSVVVFENGVAARRTYVKELVCRSLFLQIDLVRVSQTFGRHIERLVSSVVNFLEKSRSILSKSSSSKQRSKTDRRNRRTEEATLIHSLVPLYHP